MNKLELFTKDLVNRPELYDSYSTFYIRMRNADNNTKQTYNKLKNALMSYTSKFDKGAFVESELGPRDETFTAGSLAARFVFLNGQLHIHLNMDPSKLSTREAMFKISSQMVDYKLEKSNVVEQALKAIPKMMSSFSYVSSLEHKDEDYASFYSQNVEEIKEIVEASQREYEEKMGIEAVEEEPEYGDYYDENSSPRTVDSRFIEREVPDGSPSEDELLQAENERRKTKGSLKKPKMWQELADYGYDFIWLRYVEFYLATILVGVVLGVAYQLNLLWMIVTVVGLSLMMPGVIKSFYRNKYEEKKYNDATTYIEQMLYSFRKNSKIVASLRDALTVFPSGHMHDVIAAAIVSTQNSTSGTNIYSEALKIIEREYPCRRIRSLHRYMMKVEGVGGNHDAGIEALLKDRRLWVERIDAFRKDAATVLTDIYISIGFSLGLACMIVRMMSTPLVDIPSNPVYQISSTIFILVCALTIRLALKATVLYLEDEETETSSKRIVDKINWLRNYDPHKELMKSIKISSIFFVFLIASFFLKYTALTILVGLMLCYSIFLKRFLDKRSATKSVCRAIEKVYPDWLLELALLLQSDNLHVAIEKTLDSAPLIIRGDLVKLDEDIITDPTGIAPFVNFLDFLPLPQVHSSMKLLYSISEFGQAKGSVQLMELVERNSALMDKAEKYKNDDRLSATFVIKFIPMGISAVKLLADLALLLFEYMGIISNAA